MSRSFRLTRRAEASLVEIAHWTIQNFGPRQADLYEAEVIARCEEAKSQAEAAQFWSPVQKTYGSCGLVNIGGSGRMSQVYMHLERVGEEREAIAKGEVASRSCAVLVSGAEDLRFVRAGEHFLVFLDRPDEVIVVDILHSRSDLPRHVAALSALIDDEGRKDN